MKKAILILTILLLYLAALLCLSAEYSASSYEITKYELAVPLDRPMRLVQLSDLHGRQFGEGNSKLIKSVKSLEPDFILMTGDMINGDEKSIKPLLDLVEKLDRIAPVLLCYGNHEMKWMAARGEDMRPDLEKAGATVLEAQYIDLTWGGGTVRIGGYAGYYRAPKMTMPDDIQRQEEEIRLADEFENTESYKILLDHIPTAWLDWGHLGEYDVDLVFSGHYHGGQIRLPLIGGLYAPNIGFFPPYTKGLFQKNGAAAVLSAGLGSPADIPRINNPGELVCIDLLPEK